MSLQFDDLIPKQPVNPFADLIPENNQEIGFINKYDTELFAVVTVSILLLVAYFPYRYLFKLVRGVKQLFIGRMKYLFVGVLAVAVILGVILLNRYDYEYGSHHTIKRLDRITGELCVKRTTPSELKKPWVCD